MTEARRPLLTGRRGLALLGVLLVAFAAWSGTWTVAQNEQGVLLRLGRPVATLPGGIHFTFPWPIDRMVRVPTTAVRTMTIGFTGDDERAAAGDAFPAAEADVEWLTGDTNLFELNATVTYTVRDPVEYLFGCADLPDGRPRDYVIRAVTEAAVTELSASMLIDDVLSSGKTRLQNQSIEHVQTMLDALRLGVQLTAVNIVEVRPPASVVRSFNDVSTAKADRERLVTNAEGEAMRTLPQARSKSNRLLQEAEVYKAERLAAARGAAERFKKLAAEVARNPGLAKRRLWLDAVQQVLASGRVDVVQAPAEGEKVRVYVGK